ncbi:hypothetical protein [Nocardioides maradonensis]
MNTWLAAAVAVITVLAGTAAMLRWVVHNLDTRIDRRIGDHLLPLQVRIDGRIDALSTRMDAFETKLDHVAEVVDLRLKPLEEDMALVKRHLLGLPAA